MHFIRTACVLLLTVWLSLRPAQGQCQGWLDSPDQGLPGVNGTIFATVSWDRDGSGPLPSVLYVGGALSECGTVRTQNIAAWDGQMWHALGSGLSTSAVHALAVYNNELYAGTESGDIMRWQGEAWSRIGDCNASVEALTVFGNELIAGGFFDAVSGVPAAGIARWNGVSWQALGSGVGGQNNDVFGLGVYNDQLIATGNFTTAGGAAAARIARWNGTSWAALGAGLGGNGHVLTVYNSQLIVGGTFSTAGSVSASRIARWNGSVWSALGSGLTVQTSSLTVRGLAVVGNELVVSGAFLSAGGQPARNVARWNGSTWQAMDLGSFSLDLIYDLAVVDGVLYAGGFFPRHDQTPVQNIARWDGTDWAMLGSGANTSVQAIARYDGEVVVGGGFLSMGPIRANGIASWDGHTWSSLGAGVQISGTAGTVRALTVHDNDLVVAGSFSTAGGVSANNIAAWDGVAWRPLGSGTAGAPSSTVLALCVFNDDVIAAGAFTSAGGKPASRIARWDGKAWHALGSGVNTTVNALAVYQGALYAGGTFATAGSVEASRIARWDGFEWAPVAGGVGHFLTTPSINALLVFGDELVACGLFSTAGGVGAGSIARWNGIAWQPLAGGLSNTSVSPIGRAMAVDADGLVVGGTFQLAGGGAAQNVARWNGATWSAMDGGPSADVLSVGAFAGEVLIGGNFTVVDGDVRAFFARWSDTGTPWLAQQPVAQSIPTNGQAVLSVTPASGYADLTFQWRRNAQPVVDGPGGASSGGGEVTGATTDTLTITGALASDSGEYDCVVSNSCGSVTSDAAGLSVGCAADIDADGFVNSQDFFNFLGAFFAQLPSADFNADSFINSADFFDFLAAFFAGC